MTRRGVLMSAEAAVAGVAPGATIGFGGVINSTHPMSIVRELIRQGIGELHVVGLASGLEVDMLIAAGLVRELTTPTVSAETMSPIAPAFRRAAQRGEIKINETDEGLVYAALQAASQRVPFAPFAAGLGGSYADINDGMQVMQAPFTGEPILAVRAVAPEVAFIHAARSDLYGNVQVIGGGLGDRALARAADRVICTVDRIIDNQEVRRAPETTAIAGADGIVHAPFGSHPFASPGHYIHDSQHIRTYLSAADRWLREDDRAEIDAFFRRWIFDVPSHWDYLNRVGSERLHSLEEGLNCEIAPNRSSPPKVGAS